MYIILLNIFILINSVFNFGLLIYEQYDNRTRIIRTNKIILINPKVKHKIKVLPCKETESIEYEENRICQV